MRPPTRLAARPRLGAQESVVALLVRCATANARSLEDLSWWTDQTSPRQGVRALLAGEAPAVNRLAALLGQSPSNIHRGTLGHLDTFNASRTATVRHGSDFVSRAQLNRGTTTLAVVKRPRGSLKPCFVHSWRLPYCPDCLRRQPQSWPLQHHLALPGACLEDQRILLLGCPACGGAGITVAGQVQRPGHCADCHGDLRRATAMPLHAVDGLAAAAAQVGLLLGHDPTRHRPDLLAGVLDLVTLGLISDPLSMRGSATATVRRSITQAQSTAAATRQPTRLINLPDPVHVAAYLPTALAITELHLANPTAPSPLVTVHGLRTMTPFDCLLGAATRTRIRDDRRQLHHVLRDSPAAWDLSPRVPRDSAPPLLPSEVYEMHLGDLVEPLLGARGWPSPIELRHALASHLRGDLAWHRQPRAFTYGRSHEYHDEAVLHAVQEAITTAGLEEHWTAGLTAAAAALTSLNTDWQLRHALLQDDDRREAIVNEVPAADPNEAHRWLHQVWACTTEPDLGLYGPDTYLLHAGETSPELAGQLLAATDRLYTQALRRGRRQRA